MNNELPDGWKKYKLGEIIELLYGKGLREQDRKPGNIPVYGSNGIIGYHNTPLVKGPGIIIGRVGSIGKINYSPVDFYPIDTAYYVNLKKHNIDMKFLYYLLFTLPMNKLNFQSAVPGLNRNIAYSLDVAIPPLPEQRAIASIFPPIEDKIELLRQENETLEAMAETIFKQWFIKDPENKEVLLKDIYVFEKGFEPGSSNYLETEGDNTIRFIRLKDMDNKNSSIFIKKSLAKNICAPDDLLVAFDGSPGKIGFGIEGAFSSGIRKVYSVNETYNNVWLKYLIFKSKPIQNTIKTYSTGTIIQHAGSCIDKLTFKFPEESKIKEFNELITPIFIKIQQNTQQIQTLSQLFDTLLHGLMSGKLRVDDVLCQS